MLVRRFVSLLSLVDGALWCCAEGHSMDVGVAHACAYACMHAHTTTVAEPFLPFTLITATSPPAAADSRYACCDSSCIVLYFALSCALQKLLLTHRLVSTPGPPYPPADLPPSCWHAPQDFSKPGKCTVDPTELTTEKNPTDCCHSSSGPAAAAGGHGCC
jgi:hypothetical protein